MNADLDEKDGKVLQNKPHLGTIDRSSERRVRKYPHVYSQHHPQAKQEESFDCDLRVQSERKRKSKLTWFPLTTTTTSNVVSDVLVSEFVCVVFVFVMC